MHPAVENPAVITDLFSRKKHEKTIGQGFEVQANGAHPKARMTCHPANSTSTQHSSMHMQPQEGGALNSTNKKCKGHSDNESLINHPLLVSIIHLIIWVDTVWIIGFSAKLNQASALQLPFALHLKPSSSCPNWVSGNDAAPKPLEGSVLNRGTRPFSGLGTFTYSCTVQTRSRLPQYSCPQERPGHFVVIVRTTTWATKILKNFRISSRVSHDSWAKSWDPHCISKVILSSSTAERMWQFLESLEQEKSWTKTPKKMGTLPCWTKHVCCLTGRQVGCSLTGCIRKNSTLPLFHWWFENRWLGATAPLFMKLYHIEIHWNSTRTLQWYDDMI